MSKPTAADEDRRRSPRFSCGGYATINCLPSNGIVLPGSLRDLSLHGCCVDTVLPIDCGARAEIVVRVNATSFRAVGEVKEIRGKSFAGVEFLQLSAGGKDVLSDLVTDLAKIQAVMDKLKAARREMDVMSFQEQLERGRNQGMLLGGRFPLLEAILSAENLRKRSEESAALDHDANNRTAGTQPIEITIDLLG